MAALGVNKFLPFIAGSVVLLMGGAVFMASKSGDNTTRVVEGETGLSISPVEVDADNTSDTIRALSGHVTELKDSVTDVNEQNERLELEKAIAQSDAKEKVKLMEQAMETRIKQITDSNNESQALVLAEFKAMQETIGLLQKEISQTRLESEKARKAANVKSTPLLPTASENTEILPGLGLGGLNSGSTVEGMQLLDVVWINPLDRPDAVGLAGTDLRSRSQGLLKDRLPASTDFNRGLIEVKANAVQQPDNSVASVETRKPPAIEETQPYFTLPDLSTLTDAVALTSLVGRVYIDDEITNPWPFKVMIRRDNLAANYVELPIEIDGMLYEGYAVGDWTLACVRGWITAATFVFNDGTTVSAYSDNDGARPQKSRFSETAIGYISDAFGNPCVKGTPVTDAPKFLANRSLAAGLSGYATALNAEAEEVRTNVGSDGSLNTITRVLEGSRDYAANAAFAEAFSEGADWVRERQQQSFDAIYVPPGSPVVVNLQTELWLDKKPKARRVQYSQATRKINATLD